MKKSRLTPTRLKRLGKRWCPGCGELHPTDLNGPGLGAFRQGSDLCVLCEDIQAKQAARASAERERAFDTLHATDGCDGSDRAWSALSDAARRNQGW